MRCPRCGYSTFEFETCPRCEGLFEGEKVSETTPDTLPKGGFWIRFVAYAIDNLLIFIGTVFLAFVTGLATGLGGITTSMGSEDVEQLATAFGFFIGMFTGLFYFTFFVGWCGQTPGKRLCKLKVIQKTGEPMTYGRALLRYLAYIVSFIIAGLGFLMIAVDRKKRGLHDLIAGTLVVKTG
ncbi:MAG: RDD family protein [Nitrospirae bacterium]|nr:RDD family protein [Nitrospirota bacterium]